MKKPDVQPTVEAIRHMAAALREKAVKLDQIADQMQVTGNIELAAPRGPHCRRKSPPFKAA